MDGARKDPRFPTRQGSWRFQTKDRKIAERREPWKTLEPCEPSKFGWTLIWNLTWNAWKAPDVLRSLLLRQKTPRTFFHREKRSQFQKHVQLTGIPVKVRSLSFFRGKNRMKQWTFKADMSHEHVRPLRWLVYQECASKKVRGTNWDRYWPILCDLGDGTQWRENLGKGDLSVKTKWFADPASRVFIW